MDDILTELTGTILKVQLNRPVKKNAMTGAMYATLADVFKDANASDRVRVVLWHGPGDCFCSGNDVEDFLKNPPGPGQSPQESLMQALLDFDKPLVVAVDGKSTISCRRGTSARPTSIQLCAGNRVCDGASWAI